MRDKAVLELSSTASCLFILAIYSKIKEQNQTKQSMTVVTVYQILRSNFSAFLHHPQLLSNLTQSANDFLVPACKSEYYVGYSNVITELLDILLRTA